MIPLLPNPFNPDDTEFVLDSDSFMAALSNDGPASARFLLQQEVAEMRKSLAAYGRAQQTPSIAPDRDADEQASRSARVEPRFTPDAAGRRLGHARQEPMHDHETHQSAPEQVFQNDGSRDRPVQTQTVPDEDALFYLAGSLPLSIVPDDQPIRPKRK